MFLREADETAYKRVLFFEILLRRIIRWEARDAHGRRWLLALGDLQGTIEDRIQFEKRTGFYNPHSSELSYLSLSELLDIVFDRLWDQRFRTVFRSKKQMRNGSCRELNCVRNKVAHFRPVDVKDGVALNGAQDLFETLKAHYQAHLKAEVYLPGGLEKTDESLDPEEVGALTRSLDVNGISAVWDEFQRLESIRAYGMSPGMGLVSHHVFFELYTKGAFGAAPLKQLLVNNIHDITFMNIGTTASYMRVFVPIGLGTRDIQRLMRRIVAAARDSVEGKPGLAAHVVEQFDLGYFEALGADQTNLYFGFVF